VNVKHPDVTVELKFAPEHLLAALTLAPAEAIDIEVDPTTAVTVIGAR
jgi:hypothetical protein